MTSLAAGCNPLFGHHPVFTLANEPALVLGVNESWNRTTGAALAEAFHRAARGAVRTA